LGNEGRHLFRGEEVEHVVGTAQDVAACEDVLDPARELFVVPVPVLFHGVGEEQRGQALLAFNKVGS
jgi:hypothetical protein